MDNPTNQVPTVTPLTNSPPIQTPPPMPTPPQPVLNTPIAPPPPNEPVITGTPPVKKSRGFSLFIILSVFVLLGIWGFVGYLYYQNKIMDTPEETAEITETPAPSEQFSPQEIQISNGSIARVTTFGETQILVKKEDYPGTGITGFARVVVAPDNSKFCFESISPALTPAVYIANVDGTGVFEVARDRHTCTWAPDSKSVFYVNAPLAEKAVNIFEYPLDTKIEKNITESTNTPDAIRQYAITGILGDKLACTYDVVDSTGKKLSASNCSIILETDQLVEDTPSS
jgi:hypothetical protein